MNIGDTIFGVQGALSVTAIPAGTTLVVPKELSAAGIISGSGSYSCSFSTAGLHNVDINVKPVQVSGSITPTLSALAIDGSALRTVSGSTLVSGSLTTLSLSNLNGIQNCSFNFSIAGSGSITFSTAEYNGL